jgi:hypothetical protein
MLDGVNCRPDYLPRGMLDWAEEHSWLLDEVAPRWLATGEAPKRADLQKEFMARGSDVYLADVLHETPSPLIRTEAQFGWRRWESTEPSRDDDGSTPPDTPPALRLALPLTRLINHPWVVGIGGVVVGGVILAVILGHG